MEASKTAKGGHDKKSKRRPKRRPYSPNEGEEGHEGTSRRASIPLAHESGAVVCIT